MYLHTFVNSALEGEKLQYLVELPPAEWPQNPSGCFWEEMNLFTLLEISLIHLRWLARTLHDVFFLIPRLKIRLVRGSEVYQKLYDKRTWRHCLQGQTYCQMEECTYIWWEYGRNVDNWTYNKKCNYHLRPMECVTPIHEMSCSYFAERRAVR